MQMTGNQPDTGKPFIIGLIPARGGSKGIPRKNIRLLGDRPLLNYTIEAALASNCLSQVFTSTEDAEIAIIARKAGSEVIDRPPGLALDETLTLPVVQHAVRIVENEYNRRLDYVVVMQATTPFRNSQDIDNAVRKLVLTGADSVVSVCQVTDVHPWKLKRIVDDQLIPYSEKEIEGTRRQDLPPAYIRNGGIYAMRRDVAMLQNSMFGNDCRPYLMPFERSIDINSKMDFILAEIVLKGGINSGL
ncbi:MAG TPA: acylneuraminate cytidylyltransferase family protein [Candidatus Methylomirabilis sp.]|nr:acylneuraminate cytidylyltransferase family protein [Candidatus Methylomirabilis sp.]